MKGLLSLLLAGLLLIMPWMGLAEDLARGSSGQEVVELQTRLQHLGYDVGQIDGSFGAKTERALREFQSIHRLPITGVYDEATRAEIEEDLALSVAEDAAGESAPAPTTAPQPTAQAVESAAGPDIHAYGYYIDDCAWEEANRRAARLGGHLAHIDSIGEYNEIQSEILELGYADVAFWIGVARNAQGDGFSWAEGSVAAVSDTVDFVTLLNGLDPWALDCPGDDPARACVRMVYSPDEKRWVWEDVPDNPDHSRRAGYIVEFDAAAPISRVALPNDGSTPGLDTGADYRLDLLGLEDGFIVTRLTAARSCKIQVDLWNEAGDYLCGFFNADVIGGIKGRLVRLAIPRDCIAAMPEDFVVEAVLYNSGGPLGFTERTDWSACESVDFEIAAESDMNVIGEEAAGAFAYRVTFVLASDPVDAGGDAIVELYDGQSGALALRATRGEPVYLKPGIYRVHLPGGQCGDMLLNMQESPMMVYIQDQNLTSVAGRVIEAGTGAPVAGAQLTLALQGRSYSVLTDEDGGFLLQNLPPVKGRLTVHPDASKGYGEYSLDVRVGSPESGDLQLEIG